MTSTDNQRTKIGRRDFLAMAGATAAVGVAWHYGGPLSFAQIGIEQIPGEGRLDMPMLEADSTPALDLRRILGDGLRTAAPSLAFDGSGTLWAVAIEAEGRHERLVLRSFDGTRWGHETVLLEERLLHPAICTDGDGIAVACARRNGWQSWSVHLFRIRRNGSSLHVDRSEFTVEGGGIAWRPAIATGGGVLWIGWEEKQADAENFRLRLVSLQGENGPNQVVHDVPNPSGGDQFRPAIAASPEGRAWVVWDEADGLGGATVYIAGVGVASPPIVQRVTHHRAFNIAPAVAVDDRDRVWIAWQSNRRGDDKWDIPRWYYLRCLDPSTNRWFEPLEDPPGKDLDKTGTDQSFEFPRLAIAPDGKVIVTGRPSHNFCIQMLGGFGWSGLYRLPEDSWGGRGQFLQTAFDGEGNLWVIRRDIRANVMHKITDLPVSEGDIPLREVNMDLRAAAAIPLVNIQHAAARWEPLEDLEGIDEPLHHFYGDIHGHTWMSDGMGDVDEYYRIRKEYYEDDFASLTDHDTFVGKSILPGEFDLMNELTDHYNQPGRFATLFGQEYTTARHPAGLGHKCIYHTEPINLLDHTEPEQDTGEKLAARCRELGAIMIPHHVAWTGTDWENHHPDVQPLVEITSNHGVMEYQGNRPLPHRGGMRGFFVQDALAKGLRFGLIGGSDNHGLIWHHKMAFRRDSYRTGLAVVLAPDLSRESIYTAMRKRRTYATTGIKPRLDFRVNNHLMGEEFSIRGSEGVVIQAEVIAQQRLVWLQVVKDNKTWYEYGGEGYISRFTIRDTDPGHGTHWYYLRVIFENDDMAWSSPIWVNAV
ncbi:MAG: CehA/McbA family metallohydrolase [Candidatus Sumerlaeia bacterium]|nr:CehA/McbA family metallohydrolase [Candidatus Sumerlaeia bacterium]